MEKLPTHVTKFSVTLHSRNCFGCSCCLLLALNQPALIYPPLHSPTERLQVTQQGNLLYGLDNYLHKLEEISRKRNPAQGSVQEAYFRKSVHGHLVAKTGEEVKGLHNKKKDKWRLKIEKWQTRLGCDVFLPPVSGSWKLGSRPLSRNLVNFSIFLCCTYSINFFRFA